MYYLYIGPKRFMHFSIQAYQIDNPEEKVNYTTLQIFVLDVDDHSPVMNKSVYNVSVLENIPSGSAILQLTASDADVVRLNKHKVSKKS